MAREQITGVREGLSGKTDVESSLWAPLESLSISEQGAVGPGGHWNSHWLQLEDGLEWGRVQAGRPAGRPLQWMGGRPAAGPRELARMETSRGIQAHLGNGTGRTWQWQIGGGGWN